MESVPGAIPIPTARVTVHPPRFLLSPQEDFDPALDQDSSLHSFAMHLQTDLDKDRLMVNFPRAELGMSPDPGESTFPDNLGSDKFGEFARALRLVEQDSKNLDPFDFTFSKIHLHKSKSCPNLEAGNEIDSIAEEHRKKLSSISATSPRSLAKDFLQEFSQRPSSFKDLSYLEKRYSKELEDVGIAKDEDGVAKEEQGEKVIRSEEKAAPETDEKKDTERQAVVAIQAGRKKSVDFVLTDTDGKSSKEREPSIIEKPSTLPLETKGEQSHQQPLHTKVRPRGHTFSAISRSSRQIVRKAEELRIRKVSDSRMGSRDASKNGIDPSFVFLQLFYSPFVVEDTERPIAVPISQVAQRAVKVLDRIPPYDTHKIGVLYVGPNQAENEIAILSNVYGSSRYMNFLQGLGKLIPLQEAGHIEVYTGGLDTSGSDGKFVYWWKDDIMQVIFHVATLMPNKDSDPNCTAKKLHIGNDFVSIVYNESGQKYHLGTIKGQFNFAEIIVEPLDKETNLVSVQTKPELEELIGARGPWLVSDKRVALLVRQMALHANLASQIHKSQCKGTAAVSFSSNWLERLRQIGRIRSKLSHSQSSSSQVIGMPVKPVTNTESYVKNKHGVTLTDFSQYT